MEVYEINGEKFEVLPIVGIDLAGKMVLVRKEFFKEEYRNGDRRFLANGGFGCSPIKMGSAVFGTFMADGEEARIDRRMVEGVLQAVQSV